MLDRSAADQRELVDVPLEAEAKSRATSSWVREA
jgi:hypothetical protein